MNARKLIGWVGAVGAVVLLVVVVQSMRSGRRPPVASAPPPASVETTAPAANAAPLARVPEQRAAVPQVLPAPVAPRLEKVAPEDGGTSLEVVRVKADQVLGTVNGVAITLKDLIPLPKEKAGQEQVMSAEMYGFLLNRAVDRELTLQTARSLGVALTEDQRQRLAEHRSRSEKREEGVFDTLQHSPENTEFMERDLGTIALQTSLAEKAGVPSPHVTPERVEAYYQQHQAEYGALPAEPAQRQEAWARIDEDIRGKLAPQLQALHEEGLQKYLEQLRASAQIATAPPKS